MSRLKFLSSMLIFGTIGLFVHYIDMPSSVIAAARGFIGTLFLLIFCIVRRKKIPLHSVGKKLPLLCLSGAAMGANWILLFESYRFTNLATATLCYYMAPIIVIVLSPFILKEKLTVLKIIASVTAFVGMIFVSGVFTDGFSGIKGVLLALGAAALYACVMMINKKLTGVDPFGRTVLQLASSFIVLIPYCILTVSPTEIGTAPLSVILLIAVGILHTGVAYLLYFGAIPDMSGQSIAILSYTDPVTAVILSAAIPALGGIFDKYFAIGTVLIIGASLIVELIPARKERSKI